MRTCKGQCELAGPPRCALHGAMRCETAPVHRQCEGALSEQHHSAIEKFHASRNLQGNASTHIHSSGASPSYGLSSNMFRRVSLQPPPFSLSAIHEPNSKKPYVMAKCSAV